MRVLIMGAAGRDFHNFNVVFRDDPSCRVLAFTAAQIPDIAGRRYPASLAGALYPDGVPIRPESELTRLIREQRIDWVYLCYSDLSHEQVMHQASRVLAAGANFGLLGPDATMLDARLPVISVCAVRTGAGKSALARHIVRTMLDRGHRVAAVRHPMPYGELERQASQRFSSRADLDAAGATIEEREEYEPYLEIGATVFAGVDTAKVVARARRQADLLVWDGGNNDFPFLRPDLHIVMLDAHRPGHELAYHPGETNLRMADVLVVSKVDSAPPESVRAVLDNVRRVRPDVPVLRARLRITVQQPRRIRGKRVLIVGDGPTLTHGGLGTGAGSIAAHRHRAGELVDARPFAVGSIAATFEAYPHLRLEIPAMGYSAEQIRELEQTLNRAPADLVLDATPVDLSRLIAVNKPVLSVSYAFFEPAGRLAPILEDFGRRHLGSAAHRFPGPPEPLDGHR
ncbi:MAG: hypothetical protein JSW68_07350 [Burkholderiales bacterium]|nr:MAG: hypothetical protein JSW68_07350 [Burkholderiales bacterium]